MDNLTVPISLPNMSVPPPLSTNLSAPPPIITTINASGNYPARYPMQKEMPRNFFKPFKPYHMPKILPGNQENIPDEFDGKRLRKSVMRKTVDYNSAIIKTLENRIWQRDYRDRRALQPDVIYYPEMLPPPSYVDNPINAVTTRFVKTATNKMRCPIFCMAWTPEGRRLVTGASSGEFTLWNGLTFNFETILQAHDSPVRTMVWSHNENWMVTADHAGYVKYWQSNMNNVKMFQAHKEAIRGLSFSPNDHKLATCSDDGTVRIWDFLRCYEERILRGHGADVKCVHWHPQKSLIISGSKDNQQPVKLWDPKSGQSLATLHAHKSTVMDVKWNENGNWLITASRDHLLKLFDLRNLCQEVQTFRGHKKEASSVAWHPNHEGLFCSGGSDGAILFWHVGADKEVGAIEQAHDSIVWTLAWHPLGHILCSGSNDHTSKFWTRNRPGDQMRDKYNLNTLPAGAGGVDDHEVADEASVIPGMGPEDHIDISIEVDEQNGEIPGLDLDPNAEENKKGANKKVPYSKPIPRNFQAQWNEIESEDQEQVEALNAFVNQLIETTPGAVPLNEVTPTAIILYGKMINVEPGSQLAEAIAKGSDAINKLIQSGGIEELKDIIDTDIQQDEYEDYLQDKRDIDFSKTPDIHLPPPLPSSKFASNPELLKSLMKGSNQKFEQLSSWSESDSFDQASVYHHMTNDSHRDGSILNNIEKTSRFSDMGNSMNCDKNNENYVESTLKNLTFNNINEPYKYNDYDAENSENSFGNDSRHLNSSYFNSSDRSNLDDSFAWESDRNNSKKIFFSSSLDNAEDLKNRFHNNQMLQASSNSQSFDLSNNVKMPESLLNDSLSDNKNRSSMNFSQGPNTNSLANNFSTNSGTSITDNFLQPNFRSTSLFSNNFPRLPNFRPNSSPFDRNNFGFRNQNNAFPRMPLYNNNSPNNNQFNSKNSSSRNSRGQGDNRSNFHHRGRGKDDQTRGRRGRDNY